MSEFKCVNLTVNNTTIPMLSIDGVLHVFNQQLCDMMGVTENALRKLYFCRKGDFDGNCITKSNAIDYLKNNRDVFGLKYVRGDMKMWSEDDMFLFIMFARGVNNKALRKELLAVIKQHSVREEITKSEYVKGLQRIADEALADKAIAQNELKETKAMLSAFESRLSLLEDLFSFVDGAASNAGKTLRAHRMVKGLKEGVTN